MPTTSLHLQLVITPDPDLVTSITVLTWHSTLPWLLGAPWRVHEAHNWIQVGGAPLCIKWYRNCWWHGDMGIPCSGGLELLFGHQKLHEVDAGASGQVIGTLRRVRVLSTTHRPAGLLCSRWLLASSWCGRGTTCWRRGRSCLWKATQCTSYPAAERPSQQQ